MNDQDQQDPMYIFGLWLEREGVTDEEVAEDLGAVVGRYLQDEEGERLTGRLEI